MKGVGSILKPLYQAPEEVKIGSLPSYRDLRQKVKVGTYHHSLDSTEKPPLKALNAL